MATDSGNSSPDLEVAALFNSSLPSMFLVITKKE